MAEKPSSSSSTASLHDGELLCQFCWRGREVEDIAGMLHAEKSETSDKMVVAHHKCMQYASALTQYKFSLFGGFDINDVEKEIHRGSKLKCAICKGEKGKGKKATGAVCGCAIKSCRKTFHFFCAFQNEVAITKRLVVTQNKQKKKYVLYRVFCSAAHEAAFRENLKEELRQKKKWNDSSDEERNAQDDSAAATAGSKSLSASNSFNSSIITFGSPTLDTSASEKHAAKIPIQNSFQSFDTSLNHDENAPVENDNKGSEESDPTVSSSSLLTSVCQPKDRRKSGVFGRSRKSKVQASQPPQCSPIAEEMNEHSQSGKPGLILQSAEPDAGDALQKQVFVLLENLGSLHVIPGIEATTDMSVMEMAAGHVSDRDMRFPGKSALRSPGKDPVASPNRMNHVNGAAVRSSPRLAAQGSPSIGARQDTPVKDDKQLSGASHLLMQASDPQQTTPRKVVGVESSPARSGLRSFLHSPGRSSSKLSPHKGVRVTNPKNGVMPSPQRNTQRTTSAEKSDQFENEVGDATTGTIERMAVSDSDAVHCADAGISITQNHDTPNNANTQDGQDTSGTSLFPENDNLSSGGRKRPSHSAVDTPQKQSSSLSDAPSGSPILTQEMDFRTPTRKRKLQLITSPGNGPRDEVLSKTTRKSGNEAPWQGCSVLLLPAAPVQADVEKIKQMVAGPLGVKSEEVWLWQQLMPDASLLSDGHVFFVLDVVKALQSGNSTMLQTLLFDGEHLKSQAVHYKDQMLAIRNVEDDKAEKDMLDAVLSSVERKLKSVSPSPANRSQAAQLFRFQGCAAVALDLRVCDQDRHICARISAHRGLYRWTEATVADAFPIMSMESRHQTAEIESLILSTWLQEACQIQESLVYPQDPHLLDMTVSGTSSNLSKLVQTLKDKVGTSVGDVENTHSRPSEPHRAPVLLVFQPVDFEVVNFQQYFQKVLKQLLQNRQEVNNLLALVPTTNLHSVTVEALSTLVSGVIADRGLTMEILSAFCPSVEPVSLVVLKLSAEASQTDAGTRKMVAGQKGSTGAVQKRRGRPPKKKQ